MEHLGDDVAAFVDGQLSADATLAARRHLEGCSECRQAVLQQESLKARMSGSAAPAPPAALLASLANLPSATIRKESLWARVRRSRSARIGAVFLGASLAIVATAYAIGGPRQELGDSVVPTYEAYAAAFLGAERRPAGGVTNASTRIDDQRFEELSEYGWPCHETLAGVLHREGGVWQDGEEVVLVHYSGAGHRLDLYEQNGTLDTDDLDSFVEHDVDGASVWVSHGGPTIATWSDDGVVYTIVTDADRDLLADVVRDLPTTQVDDGTGSRLQHGFSRMADWAA